MGTVAETVSSGTPFMPPKRWPEQAKIGVRLARRVETVHVNRELKESEPPVPLLLTTGLTASITQEQAQSEWWLEIARHVRLRTKDLSVHVKRRSYQMVRELFEKGLIQEPRRPKLFPDSDWDEVEIVVKVDGFQAADFLDLHVCVSPSRKSTALFVADQLAYEGEYSQSVIKVIEGLRLSASAESQQ